MSHPFLRPVVTFVQDEEAGCERGKPGHVLHVLRGKHNFQLELSPKPRIVLDLLHEVLVVLRDVRFVNGEQLPNIDKRVCKLSIVLRI